MKTNTAAREVTSNVGETAVFKMSQTARGMAKGFKILIDGLYADKIQSITREIWSNALDAHSMAGCTDRPFDVSFPSAFDPSFRVRDYGVSLTHDQVMHLYTTMFESTKEDSNEQVGKLGLGSKSPFAYTDSFSVTVVLDGEKRFYAAMIGEDYIPMINFMGREDTEEENGVEVSFPVDKSDVHSFAQAARRISHGFAVKPNVTNIGASGFASWPELKTVMSGNGWVMMDGAIEGYRKQAYARMGCVLYPINANALGDITQIEREILGHTFLIDFAIGDLEITASREELSYGRNEPTTAAIKAKLATVAAELRDEVAKRYATCKSLWEASILFNETAKNYSIPDFLRKFYQTFANWNGADIGRKVFPVTGQRGGEVCLIEKKGLSRVTNPFRPVFNSLTIEAKARTAFVFEDWTEEKLKRSSARFDKFRDETRSLEQVIWIRFTSKTAMKEMVSDLMERFDGAQFVNLADYEPPVSERSYQPRRPVEPRLMSGGEFDTRISLDEEAQEDGGLYVPLERMKAVTPAGSWSPGAVYNLLVNVGAIERNTPVYGAPKSLMDLFEGDQWTNLYDFAAAWLAENGENASVMQARERATSLVRNDTLLRFINANVELGKVSADSPSQEVAALLGTVAQETVKDRSSYVFQLATALGKQLDAVEVEDALFGLYTEVRETALAAYPMLTLLYERVIYNDNLVDIVTDYVIMCDKVSQTNQAEHFELAA